MVLKEKLLSFVFIERMISKFYNSPTTGVVTVIDSLARPTPASFTALTDTEYVMPSSTMKLVANPIVTDIG